MSKSLVWTPPEPVSYEERPKPATIQAIDRPGAYLSRSAAEFAKTIGGEWHTQRQIADPQSEAESGVDSDPDDDVGASDFLKLLEDDAQEVDETGGHLAKLGQHLLKAKLAHIADDGEGCYRSLNAAMDSYQKFHSALKSQMEED
jgi:hypothetical protein